MAGTLCAMSQMGQDKIMHKMPCMLHVDYKTFVTVNGILHADQ